MSIAGGIGGAMLGRQQGKRVRSPMTAIAVKRVLLYWLVLVLFCLAVVAAAWPLDGKQLTLLIILFIMIGQWSMGLLFSFFDILVGAAGGSCGAGGLFPAARVFLPPDGRAGWGRHDGPGRVHPGEVVKR